MEGEWECVAKQAYPGVSNPQQPRLQKLSNCGASGARQPRCLQWQVKEPNERKGIPSVKQAGERSSYRHRSRPRSGSGATGLSGRCGFPRSEAVRGRGRGMLSSREEKEEGKEKQEGAAGLGRKKRPNCSAGSALAGTTNLS